MPAVATIGVYGFTAQAFLEALREADVRQLLDVRQRRGVRGSEDARLGVGKRSRVELAPEYRARYTREILARVELAPIVDSMPAGAAAALMCVERDPEACHRSLIAERLEAEHGLTVIHVRP